MTNILHTAWIGMSMGGIYAMVTNVMEYVMSQVLASLSDALI